ncbi:MAG: hypothetical protein ACOX4O_10570 [Eubacteriales bacterium]
MSDKELIRNLILQVDMELSKPFNEQDMDYIDECNAFIAEIQGNMIPDDKIKSKELKKLHMEFTKSQNNRLRLKAQILFVKKIIAAACVVLVVISSPVLIVAAFNQMSPIAVIEKWGHTIFGIPYDIPIEESGMTFIKNGNVTYYESLDKLFETEKLDIVYLGWLPDGVTLTEIVEVSELKGNSIIFNFSGEEIYYTVALYDEYSELINSYFTDDIVEINGVVYYLYMTEEKYNAIFVKDGNSYSVTANDRDILIKLLEGILEMETSYEKSRTKK